MSCSLENYDACLPITALEAINLANNKLVLSGQGPDVVLLDDTGNLLGRLRVFERNAVHGIQVVFDNGRGEAEIYAATILVWGGQSLRLIKVYAPRPNLNEKVSLSVSGPECYSPDWIFDACFYNPPRDSDESASKARGCLITAHNVVFGLEFKNDCTRTETTIQLHELPSKLRPILYSADISWVSSTHILVTAGTVFGEIIVWSFYLTVESAPTIFSNSSIHIHQFFTGHEGSIFGVDISPEVKLDGENSTRRFLASCSDDRTIRIWDISSCCSPVGDSTVGQLTRGGDSGIYGTGFRVATESDMDINEGSCLAKEWGHISRIWGVYFLDFVVSDGNISFNLISRSEDATCQLWNFKLERMSMKDEHNLAREHATLKSISQYPFHVGKNIWSMAISNGNDSFNIYTGGADGKLVSFVVGHHQGESCNHEAFRNDLPQHGGSSKTSPSTSYKKPKGDKRITRYDFVSENYFLASSATRRLLLGRVTGNGFGSGDDKSLEEDSLVSWDTITSPGDIGPSCVIAGQPQRGIGIISTSTGHIWLYHHETKCVEPVSQEERNISHIFMVSAPACYSSIAPDSVAFICSSIGTCSAVLFVVQIQSLGQSPTKLLAKWELPLAPRFAISSALITQSPSLIILGSRDGDIAMIDAASQDRTSSLLRSKIHAPDAVTSISFLPHKENQDNDVYIVTTGRDGSYCIHRITGFNSETGNPLLQTLHRSNPPFGPHIEGANIDTRTGDLILHGFRSTDFIVWNETRQAELMRIKCGSAHRKWAYHSSDQSRTILWTKTSSLNIFSQVSASHHNLQNGGHGREIKTIAITNSQFDTKQKSLQVLATGAEDTEIRFFFFDRTENKQSHQGFRCIRTVKKHTSGLQHIQWSSSGKFLFSSAGCEAFYVWRIRLIPGFGIGVVNEGAAPKEQEVSDLRIMHFDVLNIETDEAGCTAFLLAMAYSNSTVKVFYYTTSTSTGGSFTPLLQGQYTTNCLTQIRFNMSDSKLRLITGATDGHMAVWDLTDALSSTFNLTNRTIKRATKQELPTEMLPISWQYRQSVHQSSIKAMEIHFLSNKEVLIISGGDDNCLSFSRLKFPRADSTSQVVESFSTHPFPQAHASTITAIATIQQVNGSKKNGSEFEFQIASSGNDQRLKIWSVKGMCDQQDGAACREDVDISLQSDVYTAVADLSSMGQFTTIESNGTKKEGLVLCGVGMEMWGMTS